MKAIPFLAKGGVQLNLRACEWADQQLQRPEVSASVPILSQQMTDSQDWNSATMPLRPS